jgi:hypothetical protein
MKANRRHDDALVKGMERVDPTMEAMMQDHFGPADVAGLGGGGAESEGDKIQRGFDSVADLEQQAARGVVRWLHTTADSLPLDDCGFDASKRLCFRCGAAAPTSGCGKCLVAGYCSRDCQTADWGSKGGWGGHKHQCADYKLLGRSQTVAPENRRAVLSALLTSLRLYLCPFALAHGSGGGDGKERGFCLLQSPCTLAQLALPAPRDCAGQPVAGGRTLLLQFVTLDEFVQTIARGELGGAVADPALTSALAEAVETHDDRAEVVVLANTACGFAAAAVAPLVPDWRVCKTLSKDYEGKDSIQFDVDDK